MNNDITIGDLKSLLKSPEIVFKDNTTLILKAASGREFSLLQKGESVHLGTRNPPEEHFSYLNFWYDTSGNWTDKEMIDAIIPSLIARFVRTRMVKSLQIDPEEHSLERCYDHVYETGLLDILTEISVTPTTYSIEVIGDEGEVLYKGAHAEEIHNSALPYFRMNDKPIVTMFLKSITMALICKAVLSSKFDDKVITIFQ